jgi:hypothetical protein
MSTVAEQIEERRKADEKRFEEIAAAYKRGAQWWQDNADPRYLEKAASDYADYVTSPLR